MEGPANGDGLTYFARLPAEEGVECASSSGVFGGFFGRFFKPATSVISGESTGDAPSSPTNAEAELDSSVDNGMPDVSQEGNEASEAGAEQCDRTAGEPRKISDRLSSLFRLRKPSLVDYNRSDFRRYWMPDSTGKECYECQERFTAFRRRHHCRLCGQIFCAKCCSLQVPGALLGYMGDLRLCGYCARIVISYLPQIESTAEGVPKITTNEEVQVSKSNSDGLISTVSVGSLLWSPHGSLIASDGSDGASHTQTVTKQSDTGSQLRHPPSLLSVADLAIQDQAASLSPPPLSSSDEQYSGITVSVDDSEPEWVRSIELAADLKRSESYSKIEEQGSMRSFPLLDSTGDERTGLDISDSGSRISSAGSRPRFDVCDSPPVGPSLERAFDDQAQKLLLYIFKREMLDPELWWDIIWPVSKQIASTVKVDIEGRKDHMNILKYVHVKKLHVDDARPSATVIDGVVCSKSITHGLMPSAVHNAAVLTLAGSVEYERVQGKLSSIDPILTQESEYLSKQVERILAHRPSVVLVERNVANLAVGMLLRAKVTLVSNIKASVLYRVARCTRADVMPSLDAQILQQKVGFCPTFKQQKIRLASGRTKNILVFSECAPDLGCSVILRGRSQRELRSAKRVLRYMVLALYSARIEVEFLSLLDTTLSRRSRDCFVCAMNAEQPDPDPEAFVHRLRECPLSASPLIDFGVPFLETAKGRCCVLRPYFKQPLYRYSKEEDLGSLRKEVERLEQEEQDCLRRCSDDENHLQHPYVENRNLTEIDDAAVASYRAFSGRLFRSRVSKRAERLAKKSLKNKELRSRSEDVLDPFIHQRIAVLFGSYSAKSPNAPFFCVRPWVVQMEHYGNNDMTLGEFLKKFCFNKDYQCPSTNCDVPMLDHSRKMVFRRACIEITTLSCVQPGDEGAAVSQSVTQQNVLLMWHYCTICKSSSPVVPLTETAARLSFARYLDYLANGAFASCSVSSFNRDCDHCCFHQHDHYFAFNNYVMCIKINPVRPFHVMFSPVVCTIEPVLFTRKFVAEKETEIRQTAGAIFKVMASQLERFSKSAEFSRYASFHALLKTLLQETQSKFEEVINNFDPSRLLASDELRIRSNDAVYIQAIDSETRCHHIVQKMIEHWNEQSLRLAQAVRANKKSASSSALTASQSGTSIAVTAAAGAAGSDAKDSSTQPVTEELRAPTPVPPSAVEVELTPIDNPFLPQLHLTLPVAMDGVAVVVRDLVDRKGSVLPDIGSIIAYALASPEYESKRRKLRDLCSTDGIPISLRSNATDNDLAGNYEHVELDFADERSQYFVKIYYAERFHMLRKLLFVEGEDSFVRSISVSTKWDPQGGKSGASFYRTQDNRFVFKQMSRFEIQSFVKFAPNYFNYVSTAVTENKLTTLCKVYGVYRIGYKNKLNGQQLKLDVLVMEYLFYKRNVKQVWDLKGSQRNRMASEGKRTADLVLLDENLVKDLWNNQLYVHPHSKAALNMAISNDSHFLSAQHVMDYSLLVGVDEANEELILGIVDYMRTYTLDKKLESWVKIVAIPGAHLPTVISPEMYCTRFSDAIDTYFPVAPDQWTGLGTAMSY